MDVADKQKALKYIRLCKRQDAMFVSLSAETHGALGKGITSQVDYLVEQAISSPLNQTFSDEDAKLLREDMLNEISCSIQKGNAMIISQGIALSVLKPGCFNPRATRIGPLPKIPDQLNEEARKQALAKMGIDPLIPVFESEEEDEEGDRESEAEDYGGMIDHSDGDEGYNEIDDHSDRDINIEAVALNPLNLSNEQQRLQQLREHGIALAGTQGNSPLASQGIDSCG